MPKGPWRWIRNRIQPPRIPGNHKNQSRYAELKTDIDRLEHDIVESRTMNP